MIQKINLGAAPNDKTGTKARAAGQMINANFDYLEAKIDNVDQLVLETGFSLVGQNLTMNTGWQWLINGIPYTNPADVVINIPFATTGKERIDLIVLNTSNTFTRIPGTESVSNPVAQPVPNDTVQATLIVVTDGVVEQPSTPVSGNSYVAKLESSFIKLQGTGAKAAFSLTSETTNVRVMQASSIASITISNADKKYIYPGKDHYIKNETGTTLIIKHNSGTGNYKYFFPNSADLVIQNNEIIHCKWRIEAGNSGFLDYVGIASSGVGSGPIEITDVTGLTAELADRYTKSEVDAKVASVYVFKGNVANYAALPSTGQEIGWTYNLSDTGANYAWTGTVWDKLGDTIDISGKEDSSNKSNEIEADKTSTVKWYSAKAIYDFITGGFQRKLVAGTNIAIDNTNPLAPIISASGGGISVIKTLSTSSVESYGDSIIMGYGATAGYDVMSLLSSYFSLTNVNRAVSGRGIWEATRLHNLNINTGNTKASVLMAGFNDVRRGGNAVKTISKIKNGYRAIIANHFIKTFVSTNSGSSAITSSGTWLNYPSATYGGKSASLGGYNSVIGSYKQYSFTDNNVVVAFIGSDGVGEVHGNFDVHIDGVFIGNYTANATTDGISDGSNDNARAPFILYFGGLTDALHTIKITLTTANYVVLDYFGNLKAPRFTNPLFLVQAPKMNSTGYATSPALATDAIINELNSELTNVIAEFSTDYPIINVKTNDYYNISNGISADNIHPNDTGYRQIYSAIVNDSHSLFINKPTVNAVRQISSATILTDADNGLVIILTGSATVTIPNGLIANFECTLVTLAGAILTTSLGGSVTLLNNTGTTMAEKLSVTIKNTLSANQYLTVGNL
jgi:lysophospholipase L1-like esterase